jgi:superfamily II DNA or RNA helicase
MSDSKRERQRRKKAEKLKRLARARAEEQQSDARRWRSYDLAEDAEDQLEMGNGRGALVALARAAELNPGDPELAQFYLSVAEREHDVQQQEVALGLVIKLSAPDARLLARHAFLQLQTGNREGARETARTARALLPARVKGRKEWLSIITHVEASASASIPPRSVTRTGKSASAANTSAKKAGRQVPGRPSAGGGRSPTSQRNGAAPQDSTTAAGAELHSGAPPASAVPAFLEVPVDIAPDVEGIPMLSTSTFAAVQHVELAVLAARLRDAESYQQLFSIERAQGLTRFSYQEDTARKVLSVFLGRALLADEVGLGKTVEAGLVLSEYLLRGRIDRALVLAPPSLIGQWREELASKFGIQSRTTEDASFRQDPGGFWSRSGVVIASLATARSPRQLEFVTARQWDLLIVDEAHALKNAASASYNLVSKITSRFLLLLTATPVENRVEELYNLVSLLRPGHLGGRAAFLKRFSDRKVGASEAARAEVRSLLSEVMVRNTRALSGVHLPPRFARTILVTPLPGEATLYQELANALRVLGRGGRTGTLLSILLQEAGSSPFAARATLVKTAGRNDLAPEAVAALAPAIRCSGGITETGKSEALLRVLGDGSQPTVVFTRFRPTLEFLGTVFRRSGIPFEQIDGNVPPPLRNDAIARLQASGGVLLSTEVGAEGLNLQFCTRIVNFDLPWNPMRIEQRIGRVHRIGQEHAVDVVNFCLAGSIEERILTMLDERINLFELVIGEAEMILGYLEDDREFDDLVLDAFADPDVGGRERSFARIGDALAAARTRYDNVRRFDEGFFRNELGV